MNKIVVGIPCYNCAPQIARLMDEIEGSPSLAEQVSQFYFIDNGSHDGTRDVIARLAKSSRWKAKMILVKNQQNYGLGGTQKIAFRIARSVNADLLVILHGDHQARFNDLSKLLACYSTSPQAAAVLGSRFSRGSIRSGYSRVRTCGNKALNLIYSLFWFRRIEDLGSGLNLFAVSEFPESWVEAWSDQFSFNMDLLLALLQKNKIFHFVAIRWYEIDQVSNARNIRVGLMALQTLWRYRCGRILPSANNKFEFISESFPE